MRRAQVVAAAGLALLTLAAFTGISGLGFVYDDVDYILTNERVVQGLTADGVRWAFVSAHSSNWHPLTWISHMADVSIWGQSAAGHHLTSLLLHVGNALLLFLLLRRITGTLRRAALVAAVFAVHPLRVESVAYVAERKDVLSVFFGFLAVHAYARYLARRSPGRYALTLLFFALALMAKPMLVTLPLLLLILDYWPLGRLAPIAGSRIASGALPAGRRILGLWAEKLPLFLLAAAASAVAFFAQSQAGSVAGWFSWGLRGSNAVVSYARYLGLAFWPRGLAAFYPFPSGAYAYGKVFGAGLLVVSISAATLLLARRKPFLAAGWLWYLVALLPVIGIIQIGSQALADRYTYLPLVGIAIAVVWGGAEFAARQRTVRLVIVGVAWLVPLALAATTRRQVTFWKDDLTLSGHAMEVVPDNWFMQLKYAAALTERGRGEEAVAYYRKALKRVPAFPEGHVNLGAVLVNLGRTREAVAHYREAIRLRPGFVLAHMNLANVLSDLGRNEEAVAHYREALSLNPANPDVHYNLGVTLAAQGKPEAAAAEYREALRLRPGFSRAQSDLARLMSSAGR